MSTHYNPFGNSSGWFYKERMPGRDEWHSYLGPCPQCGTACFNYGAGWRCLALYCSCNASNPVGNLGPAPEWWNTNILVTKDGDMWGAHYDDFINLQESPIEFANTPGEAVELLIKNNHRCTDPSTP